MSPARLAELHRAIAHAHLALADELDGSEGDEGVPPPPLPQPRRRRGPRLPRGFVVTQADRDRVQAAGGIFGD